MKKIFILTLIGLVTFNLSAQEVINPDLNNDSRVITTGVPFILIAGDARSAGMADIGVSSSSDAFSQQWNPAKYVFAISKQEVGLTYTPYLSQLVNYIFLVNLTYYHRINERSSVAVILRFFSLEEIEFL